MEYTSLYRRFRPLTFDEIVGQEHITQTLKNEIIANRVGHAYLFNGGRGTGKTSAAKILARAVNCLNPKNGEPCNKCEICKAALDGSLTDIVEMDAASNNSVEDIRAIKDEVNFLPTLAKYRVYIIDEVHMLSTGAFNALLKTLEEPPAHVKFILATTEPQKLPATILSRCQRFDFKKISQDNIEKRLRYVSNESSIDITDEAISIIAILAEGGMRDALSILERCMQEQTQITEETVKELVGIPQLSSIYTLTKNIIQQNTQATLDTIQDVINSGKDIENFLWEFTKYIKDILVYKANGNLKIYNEDEKKQIMELSETVSKDWLVSVIYELSDLSNQLKWSEQKIIMFQVEMIKLSNASKSISNNIDNKKIIELDQKITNLEKEIKLLENNKNIINTTTENKKTQTQTTPKEGSSSDNNITKKTNVVIGKKIENWQKILENIKHSGKILVYTNLMNSIAIILNDVTVGISFPKGLSSFGKTILEKQENMNEIVKQVSVGLGKTMRIKILDNETEIKEQETTQADNLAKELDIPIKIIDD